MSKKTAIIFGGSGGIGIAVAQKMIENNIHVCLVYFDNKNIEKLVNNFQKGQYSLYKTDLSDENAIKLTVEQIIKDHQKIDIIVFSVSNKLENKPVFKLNSIDFNKHYNLQTLGLLNIVKSLEPQIKEKNKMKIVIVLSEVCICKPPAGLSHYTSSKYSLMGLTKTLAVELARYQCNVNMVSPGMVDTGLISGFPSKLIEITAEDNPLKRIATPGDVANAIIFLSSEESDYLNGVNIAVNGGGLMQ